MNRNVPEGMLKEAVKAMNLASTSGDEFRSTDEWAGIGLTAALDWQAAHPQPLDEEAARKMLRISPGINWRAELNNILCAWQRRWYAVTETDPAEEAVRKEIERQSHNVGVGVAVVVDYVAIVAAVDKARADSGKEQA